MIRHNWCVVKSGPESRVIAFECASNGYREDKTCNNCGARVDRGSALLPAGPGVVLYRNVDAAYNSGLGPFTDLVLEAAREEA